MGIKAFFRQLFHTDGRIDFYAKIFALLIATSESDEEFELSSVLFLDSDEQNEFDDRLNFHLKLIKENELHINQLVRRINEIHHYHPHWIKTISNESMEIVKKQYAPLQQRAYEFIANLKEKKSLIVDPLKSIDKSSV